MLPAYWRPGDTVLNWFEMEIPSGTGMQNLYMRVGMYEYPSLTPVVVDEYAGAEEWVILGPLGPKGLEAGSG